MTRAAIVARVSHKQQLAAGAGGRHSLISQRETLERMAERNVATYEIPGESAFRDEMKARPLFGLCAFRRSNYPRQDSNPESAFGVVRTRGSDREASCERSVCARAG